MKKKDSGEGYQLHEAASFYKALLGAIVPENSLLWNANNI
jgi:hypothetical protein